MSVISIKRLLGAQAPSVSHPLRLAQILLRGMGLHAVEGDPEAFRPFRDAMGESADSIVQTVTEAAALVIIAAALRSLEEHNRGAENYLHSGGNDLRAMVKMLTTAIREFSVAGNDNVKGLKLIENRVASAQQGADITSIKRQLATCLREIQQEGERQKLATAATVGRLQEDLNQARTESVDPATGLPPRSKAVECVAETCISHVPAFAICMAIDHLQNVNRTFGSEVGDQILRYFATYVQGSLPPGDRLFRWTGACLLAVAPRAGLLESVHQEFARLMEHKLEYTIETPTRSALLPITARWTVFPFTAKSNTLIQQIDAFASPTGTA